MARPPKPWFREDRQAWFVTIAGTRYNLGPDPKQAEVRFHQLMAASLLDEEKPTPPIPEPTADSVAVLCDRFVEWLTHHRAADTVRWYQDRLQAFLDHIPQGLSVTKLKPFHVQEWIDKMPHKSGTKRNYVRAVKRALGWAEEQGYIDRSPLAHMKKPACGRRDNVISPEDHARILTLIRDSGFRDLCDFCFLTGARCAEALAAEARHLDLANHRLVFPVDEEKMERIPRVIYLGAAAEAILARLAALHPTGELFRNTDGVAWTPDATNCRFRTLAKKFGRKVCLTDYRHSFAQRLLTQEVDALTVSVLLGHADTGTLSRVYAHLNHASAFLLEAAKKADVSRAGV